MAAGEITQLPVPNPLTPAAVRPSTQRQGGREPKPGRRQKPTAMSQPYALPAGPESEQSHRIDVLA